MAYAPYYAPYQRPMMYYNPSIPQEAQPTQSGQPYGQTIQQPQMQQPMQIAQPTPTNDMISTINKLHTALDFDFVGVDFIRNGGRWVLNEIEDVVGTRMLYSLTDIDAADRYIEYILGKLKEKLCTTN